MRMALITAMPNMYVRDTRHIVESTITVVFWLAPIFSSLASIPAKYSGACQRNSLAAMISAVPFLRLAIGLAVLRRGKSAFCEDI
jgi:ABC-type polysaccharide/polyol phosphate export permease